MPASATYADFTKLYPLFREKYPTQYVFLDGGE
jgi:hypothetical protein